MKNCTVSEFKYRLACQSQMFSNLILIMSRQAKRVSFLLVLLLSFSVVANEPTTFETSNTPISEFVSWYAAESGQTIVLGHGVTGTVSFTAKDLKPSEYPAFFNSVLRSHGYMLNIENGIYVVRPNAHTIAEVEPSFVKLYRLDHVRNTKVTDLISSMLSATQTQSVNNQPIKNYNVEVLPTTNAVIITGTRNQLQQIDALMKGIDRPQRQVFIEAVITETSIDKSHEVGVNLEAAFNKAGFITNTVVADLTSDNVVMYDSGNFDALVKAISSDESAKLLSRPNMLIMDRERGYITVGQNVPFIIAKEVTDGGNTIQQIERKDVGVSLDVIPHIMGEDVILQIAQESQSVTNSTAAADIITNKRTLQTVVKVKSQQTIVLGGLISDEEKVSESGVPVLKDIPVLGWFFRSEKTVHQQKELRVVIKTTVL
ncbi:Type 3 secretion system secretin [Vibrio marisflavi CECT 7928]|uniref:Type 3 secretion system secretin n=2 Tax=Vibrio marisflavi TaxID=1216040 RepID=A0ABM9A0E9_9VIBR|nr:Type 3 secretion system secretin [Vibrio marisflavi CECT 7928]